jgi:hypothetical protein
MLAMITAITVSGLAAPGSAEAHARRHWHHYDRYTLYYDYSFSNVQSRWTYIYPAANWGPFFHHVRHYGTVLYLPRAS